MPSGTRPAGPAGCAGSARPETEPLPEDFDLAEPEVGWPEASAEPPGRRRGRRRAHPERVVLIARTRVEGEPLAEVAQALGRPYEALRKERRRAEAALRAFARRYVSEGS